MGIDFGSHRNESQAVTGGRVIGELQVLMDVCEAIATRRLRTGAPAANLLLNPAEIAEVRLDEIGPSTGRFDVYATYPSVGPCSPVTMGQDSV